MPDHVTHPHIFVVAGPSAGVGKGTLEGYVRQVFPDLEWAVTCTTRGPRPGEVDGKSYHFITREEFHKRLESDYFLEYDEHAGALYGTPREEIEGRINFGKSVLVEVDVLMGAPAIRKTYPDVIDIYISPPSFEELERRLRSRGTESEVQIQHRLELARRELEVASDFKYKVINDDLDKAKAEIREIFRKYLTK